MPRWLPRITICVVLGVVTTLAVSWAIAFVGVDRTHVRERHRWPGQESGVFLSISRVPGCARIHAESWGTDRLMEDEAFRQWWDRVGPSWVTLRDESSLFDSDSRVHEGLGWPLPALWRSRPYDTDPAMGQTNGVISGWKIGRGSLNGDLLDKSIIVLPLGLCATGFVANSILGAGAWWLILMAPGLVRRVARRRRGRCDQCGYDLRGDFDSGCPECGWNRK